MRTFVMGDIHGCHKALIQCLQRCKFNKEEDVLIQLGDVADGWPEVYECVEELLTIPNLISIKGNHDDWWLTYTKTGIHPAAFTQGGFATLKSYGFNCLGREWEQFQVGYKDGEVETNFNIGDIPETHLRFFEQQHIYYVDEGEGDYEKYKCFVHGGFNRHQDFTGQDPFIYYWDRDLWMSALSFSSINSKFRMKTPFAEVFIGHTATTQWGKDTPMQAANIWNLDTGAGYKGRLTIMDVDTHEFWQSDPVKLLYPNEIGR